MNTPSLTAFNQQHGRLVDGHTLRIQRRLPGTAERVWSYLVDGELRRQWLAAGTISPQPGTSFELVWRNDELSASPEERPEGFGAESRAVCTLQEFEPPRRLRYLWPEVGEVCFELEPAGSETLLTLTHRRLAGERLVLNVSAGWHAHLARLVALCEGSAPPSLWSTWKRLRDEYAAMAVAG